MPAPRRIVLGTLAFVVASAVAFGLLWFQPWKLFIDHRVDEKLPAVALESPAADVTASGPAPGVIGSANGSAGGSVARSVSTAVLLARGRLISHEHSTSGTVSVVRQADGSRVLAIANLKTSDGPDVHVWLTDAPVLKGGKGWHVFDDGRHINLGTLKGNLGDQVYRIPRSADLGQLTSISIWCERFDVSFGAAELVPV